MRHKTRAYILMKPRCLLAIMAILLLVRAIVVRAILLLVMEILLIAVREILF